MKIERDEAMCPPLHNGTNTPVNLRKKCQRDIFIYLFILYIRKWASPFSSGKKDRIPILEVVITSGVETFSWKIVEF